MSRNPILIDIDVIQDSPHLIQKHTFNHLTEINSFPQSSNISAPGTIDHDILIKRPKKKTKSSKK